MKRLFSSMTTVSVIIPAFNASAFIIEAIESVVCQTLDGVEIIVVDDGSSDETVSLVRTFGKAIKLITQSNRGASEARNRGVREASGEFVAFLDADDLWEPNKLSRQMAAVGRGDGICYTDRVNFGQLGALSELQSDGVLQPSGNVYRDLLLCNFITTSSVLMRRQLFLDLGGFNKCLRVAHDWDLWLRVAENYTVVFCAEPLVRYRVHSSGISKTAIETMFWEQERILDEAFARSGNRQTEFPASFWSHTRISSAGAAAFAAANAGQWGLAIKMYGRRIARGPLSISGYKGLLKSALRKA
jgi:glycosyltransferase involved in cell wall biosynthesis